MGAVWQRGGEGQSIWMLMTADPELHRVLPRAIRCSVEDGRIETAVRLLMCFQAVAEHVPADVDAVVHECPDLLDNEFVPAILEMTRNGRTSLFQSNGRRAIRGCCMGLI